MDHFKLHSEYKPTGDQPQAIENWSEVLKKATSSRLYWVSQAPARPSLWRTSSPSLINQPSSSPTTKLSRHSFTER